MKIYFESKMGIYDGELVVYWRLSLLLYSVYYLVLDS